MKLIRKLGTRKSEKGHSDSWGLYRCGYCELEVERRIPNKCKSCGCAREKLIGETTLKHGDNRSRKRHGNPHPLYSIWSGMKARCSNNKSKAYKWYGGKGVQVCKEWLEYLNFKEWALANGYKIGLSIDRVDSNGNYCPENCQWITREENTAKGAKPNARFSWNETQEIKKIFSTGKFTQKAIASAYNVSKSCIQHIVNGKSYKRQLC